MNQTLETIQNFARLAAQVLGGEIVEIAVRPVEGEGDTQGFSVEASTTSQIPEFGRRVSMNTITMTGEIDAVTLDPIPEALGKAVLAVVELVKSRGGERRPYCFQHLNPGPNRPDDSECWLTWVSMQFMPGEYVAVVDGVIVISGSE